MNKERKEYPTSPTNEQLRQARVAADRFCELHDLNPSAKVPVDSPAGHAVCLYETRRNQIAAQLLIRILEDEVLAAVRDEPVLFETRSDQPMGDAMPADKAPTAELKLLNEVLGDLGDQFEHAERTGRYARAEMLKVQCRAMRELIDTRLHGAPPPPAVPANEREALARAIDRLEGKRESSQRDYADCRRLRRLHYRLCQLRNASE